jgi:hypothetical protein
MHFLFHRCVYVQAVLDNTSQKSVSLLSKPALVVFLHALVVRSGSRVAYNFVSPPSTTLFCRSRFQWISRKLLFVRTGIIPEFFAVHHGVGARVHSVQNNQTGDEERHHGLGCKFL